MDTVILLYTSYTYILFDQEQNVFPAKILHKKKQNEMK